MGNKSSALKSNKYRVARRQGRVCETDQISQLILDTLEYSSPAPLTLTTVNHAGAVAFCKHFRRVNIVLHDRPGTADAVDIAANGNARVYYLQSQSTTIRQNLLFIDATSFGALENLSSLMAITKNQAQYMAVKLHASAVQKHDSSNQNRRQLLCANLDNSNVLVMWELLT